MKNFPLKPVISGVTCVSAIALAQVAVAADPISLPAVKSVYLETNGCTPQFTEELIDADYALMEKQEAADASLVVDVHQLDASMGASARYSAKLRTQSGQVLFAVSGREDSIDQEELCEDISEDVVDALVDKTEDFE